MEETQPDNHNKRVPELQRPFIHIWLALLLIIAAFTRVHDAGNYAYSPDEAMLVGVASPPTASEVWEFSTFETQPPLGHFIRHYWMAISDTPWFVRGESLIFGLALILLYWRIGLLVNGALTGMCCALIIAISRGCIIQSYIARNYIFFLLFISAAFYCYLLWRRNRKTSALAGYAIFGGLAVATHFSALFTVFCIGVWESASMLRRRAALPEWAWWIAANTVVAATAAVLYYLWLPALNMLGFYFTTSFAGSGLLVPPVLVFPLASLFYLSPNVALTIPLACGFAAAAVRPGSPARINPELRFFLALTGLGYALSMVLFATGIYPSVTGRHYMWLFPFIVPALGWLLADICTIAAERLWRWGSRPGLACIIFALTALGALAYRPAERFGDNSEYGMTAAQYDSMIRFYASLGPRDLLVMERDDAILLKNVYPLLGGNGWHPGVNATATDYQNTRILFNPFYRRIYSKSTLLDTLREAQEKHMLDGVDRLVFYSSLWPRSIMVKLMLCAALDKQVTVFPPLAAGQALTQDTLGGAQAVLMQVSKETFLNEVVSPQGKAHACISSMN